MNDEPMTPAGGEETQSIVVPGAATVPPEPRRVWLWLWNVLAGNPFYPLSALLLLWGISCCVQGTGLLAGELRQLYFNFSALQLYEAVVVLVAWFLARRRLWYDCTLLVVLENGLMFVPLMLVMQALMITQSLAVGISMVAAVLMVGRALLLRRGVPGLNYPAALMGAGMLIMLVNLSLPLVYRPMIMDLLPDAREAISRWIWYVGLPCLPALGFFLPRRGRWNGVEAGRCWLPLSLLSLWVAGTVVAVRCAEYVASLPFTVHYLAPVCWVWGWLVYAHLGRMLPGRLANAGENLALLPMAGVLLPLFDHGDQVLVVLVVLNTGVLAALYGLRRSPWMRQALVASVGLLVAFMPVPWAQVLGMQTRESCVVGGLVVYILMQSLLLRTAGTTLMGAMAMFIGSHQLRVTEHEALQVALAFGVLLSLTWRRATQPHWVMQHVMAVIWGLHAGVLVLVEGAGVLGMQAWGAMAVLAGVGVARWRQGAWHAQGVAAVAMCILTLAPCQVVLRWLRLVAPNLWAVAGSFVLMGIGTAFALARQRLADLAHRLAHWRS